MKQQNMIILYPKLGDIVHRIADRFSPKRIICFASINNDRKTASSFVPDEHFVQDDFFLLVVTKDKEKRRGVIQDFVNKALDGLNDMDRHLAVTIMVYSNKTVEKNIKKGNRFFITVCRDGTLLYLQEKSNPNILESLPDIDPCETYKLALNAQWRHQLLASGLFDGISPIMEGEYYRAAMLILHQAAEQMFTALIAVFTGYQPKKYSLMHLYNFCRCFLIELDDIIPLYTEYQQLQFKNLSGAFHKAKHKTDFQLSGISVKQHEEMVDNFIVKAMCLCDDRVEEYRDMSLEHKRSTGNTDTTLEEKTVYSMLPSLD